MTSQVVPLDEQHCFAWQLVQTNLKYPLRLDDLDIDVT